MGGSSAPLRRLGTELRRLREATGRTQVDVGKAIGRTHATFVNWERGKTKISKSDLVCLLAELGTPPDIRKALEDLRTEANRASTGQWATNDLPGSLRPLVSFEQDAEQLATFQPSLIPGLLQTEAYTRAMCEQSVYTADPSITDRWTRVRMDRQRRLSGDKPLKLHAVIAECALQLEIGGRTIVSDQLDHLLSCAKRRNITIQILADRDSGRSPVHTNLAILHFPDPATDPALGHFDSPLSGHLVDDPGNVVTLIKMFEQIRKVALSPSASAKLIAAILERRRQEDSTDDRARPSNVVQVKFHREQR